MKRIAIACALALAGASAGASADEAQNCASIKQSAKRLACFDGVGRRTTARGSSPESRVAAASVLKTLRKLDSATSIGINMRDYAALVRDSSADIDEDLRLIPDGDFRDKVSESKQAYVDANMLWTALIPDEYVNIWLDHSAALLKKYSINQFLLAAGPDYAKTSGIDRSAFLSPIWARAKVLSDMAETLSANPSSKALRAASVSQSADAHDSGIVEYGKPHIILISRRFAGGAYADHSESSPQDQYLASRAVQVYAVYGRWARITPAGETPRWIPSTAVQSPADY